MARRLVEARRALRADLLAAAWRTNGAGTGHANIAANHASFAGETDKPIAALLTDLQAARAAGIDARDLVRRVRPAADRAKGRHRPRSQSARLHRLAGRRRRQGRRPSRRDRRDRLTRPSIDRVSVNDLHATILHLLGIDHERLTYRYNGRDFRLTDVAGKVVRAVLE